MTSVTLGQTPDGNPVRLDVDRLVASRLLLQANSGGGKSWTLRRLLEQTHGHVQHLVLDIEGEFASLREKFDYVLAARTGGDVVADVRHATLLARRLLELGISAIIDLYELKQHERVLFVRRFLEALIDAPKNLWHPALVVIDEAHQFCPQNGEAESAAAVIDLMTRGRKRGFCGVLATQRLAKLNKDAAADCNVKLIGRAAMDVDLKRAGEELQMRSAEDLQRIRNLKPGTFFAFGPGLSETVVEVQIGPTQTTHPKLGRGEAPVPPPRDRVKKLLGQLVDLPKEAAEEARTLAESKAEITKLRRDLAAAAKAAPPAPKAERVEVPVLKDAQVARIEKLAERMEAAAARLTTQAAELRHALPKPQRFQTGEHALRNFGANGIYRPGGSGNPPADLCGPSRRGNGTVATHPRPAAQANDDGEPLTGPEQRILDAIAWLESSNGREAQEQTAVAFVAGYTVGGGAFNNPRGRLNSRGLIEYRGGDLVLTSCGRAIANVPDVALDAGELQSRVLQRLPGPEQKLLRVLLDAYPNSVENGDLARRAGYEPGGGAFNNPRGRLRSLGLVHYPQKGTVAAAPVLFLEGATS